MERLSAGGQGPAEDKRGGGSLSGTRTAIQNNWQEVVIMDVHEKELLARAIIELIETNDGVQRAVIRCVCSSPNIVKVM